MGLFNKHKDKTDDDVLGNAAEKFCGDSNVTEADIKRLCTHAGAIINMLNSVFTTSQGVDIQKSLLYASGLAGYACHSAVKSINPSLFTLIDTENGKKYYYGDAVNKFLLENKYSVRSFCDGIYHNLEPNKPIPDCIQIVKNIVASLGHNYLIFEKYKPEEVYHEIRDCFNGIYHNMTEVYCKSPSEWPVLFSIVLQNIMKMAMDVAPKDQIYIYVMECACYISKMDDDSI